MARTYVGLGGGHAGEVAIMMPDHNSGGLLLLCMILMSLSLISMVIFACGDSSGSPRPSRPGGGGCGNGGGGCGSGGCGETMARTYVGLGGGHAGEVAIMMPDHNSGGLLLLCMILMSLSLISMVIFACGDSSGSPRPSRPGGGGCGNGGGGCGSGGCGGGGC
ncbi:unnamed protein product [Malus baccata var. baccata]